jgi:hypothetical protein
MTPDQLSDQNRRPCRWNYAQAEKPDFADFAEPFCAGWNAHKDAGDADGEEFSRLLMAAYERSGAMLAYKVNTGQMTEAEARVQMGRAALDETQLAGAVSTDELAAWLASDEAEDATQLGPNMRHRMAEAIRSRFGVQYEASPAHPRTQHSREETNDV